LQRGKPKSMNKNKTIKIDIEAVLKSKAPNTYLPKFIINIFRRIVHEKDFNQLFKDNAGIKNLDFIEKSLQMFDITTSVYGKENLPPAGGKYIFVSNHPLGGLDGLTIGLMIGREYDGKVKLFTNDLLMFVEPLSELFIPVNKVGNQAKMYAETLQNFFDSDNHLITFPAGICSRKVKGKIVDLDWKKNFISKAIQHKRDIVPIYFEGRNSSFFYNLANIRKMLGIKLNIEMFFLADEMFKQKGKNFTIKIGKPIPWQTFNKSKSQTYWAQWVKEIVYKIGLT